MTATEGAPATPVGAARPRSRKGAASRTRLLAAAKSVFEEDGFLAARVSDIAERAGLSHGSFYYYFDSKEEVFREVAVAVEEALGAPLGEVVLSASEATPAERLREAIGRHFERYRAEAGIMGLIEEVSRYDPELAAIRAARDERYIEQIADSIRRLQARGLADRSLDPEVAARALGGLTYRFAELWLVQDVVGCPLDAGIEQVTVMFVNALGLGQRGRSR